jgi:hypothetical protein
MRVTMTMRECCHPLASQHRVQNITLQFVPVAIKPRDDNVLTQLCWHEPISSNVNNIRIYYCIDSFLRAQILVAVQPLLLVYYSRVMFSVPADAFYSSRKTTVESNCHTLVWSLLHKVLRVGIVIWTFRRFILRCVQYHKYACISSFVGGGLTLPLIRTG